VLCVHVASDELGALTHDFCQNGFTISVNGCHLDQFNDAPPRVLRMARFSPSRLEYNRPLADQLTLQRPSLLIRQIGYSDLQHYSPLTACQKPPRSEALRPTTFYCSLTIPSSEICAYLSKRILRRWTGPVGPQPSTEFATATRPYKFDLPGITNAWRTSSRRTRKDMAVEKPNARGACELSQTLALTAFRVKDRGTEYREANDPETEI
jgi:hypothetical protein